MAGKSIVDVRELKKFATKLEKAANGKLKKQFAVWLEAVGMEFLGVVQDEIIRLGVVDTRRLLNSFSRGNGDCVFKMKNNALLLEVGTNVEYAAIVNDGHKLVNSSWWEGYHYFDLSIVTFEKILPASLEKRLQEWLDEF